MDKLEDVIETELNRQREELFKKINELHPGTIPEEDILMFRKQGEHDEAVPLAAAIRQRWPWIDFPCQHEGLSRTLGRSFIVSDFHYFGDTSNCVYCGEPKPAEEK